MRTAEQIRTDLQLARQTVAALVVELHGAFAREGGLAHASLYGGWADPDPGSCGACGGTGRQGGPYVAPLPPLE